MTNYFLQELERMADRVRSGKTNEDDLQKLETIVAEVSAVPPANLASLRELAHRNAELARASRNGIMAARRSLDGRALGASVYDRSGGRQTMTAQSTSLNMNIQF